MSCIERKQTTGELIDKTKGKIKHALGDLTGNERLKRESERDDRKA